MSDLERKLALKRARARRKYRRDRGLAEDAILRPERTPEEKLAHKRVLQAKWWRDKYAPIKAANEEKRRLKAQEPKPPKAKKAKQERPAPRLAPIEPQPKPPEAVRIAEVRADMKKRRGPIAMGWR